MGFERKKIIINESESSLWCPIYTMARHEMKLYRYFEENGIPAYLPVVPDVKIHNVSYKDKSFRYENEVLRPMLKSYVFAQMTDAQWEELKGLTDLKKAAELFCVYYERCVNGQDATVWYKPGALYQDLNKRKQFAQNAYDIYMGDDSKGLKDGA